MRTFETSEGLDAFLKDIMNKVITNITNEILIVLQNNIIQNTYNNGVGNSTYFNGSGEPTYEFLEAFRWGEIKSTVDGFVRELTYDYMTMGLHRASDGLHAHIGNLGQDMRASLVDILDTNGLVAHKQRSEFWQPTIDWIEVNFDHMVIKGFKKYGVDITIG